jgi:pyruvate/2-oxoglutarate dehydrogenase complex dihydrolipoamide acyltransferase (E2) component
MSRHAVRLPDLGFDQPARVLTWFMVEGKPVVAGDPLVELLVEGASVVIPAPREGVLAQRLAGDENEIDSGSVLCYLE